MTEKAAVLVRCALCYQLHEPETLLEPNPICSACLDPGECGAESELASEPAQPTPPASTGPASPRRERTRGAHLIARAR